MITNNLNNDLYVNDQFSNFYLASLYVLENVYLTCYDKVFKFWNLIIFFIFLIISFIFLKLLKL